MHGFADPRTAASDWAVAWRDWRNNPLGVSFTRATAQREAALPWYRRNPGLLIIGALLSLAATGANLWLLRDSLQHSAAGMRPFAVANANLGLGITLIAALLFCLCWLAARSFAVYSFALGFLERTPRTRFRHSVDDMLAVSALSEQELLVGGLRYGLSQLLWPLAVSSLGFAVLAVRQLAPSTDAAGSALPQAGLALLLWVMLLSSAILVNTALILIAMSLSIAQQAGPWPGVGAVGLMAMQVTFAAGVVAFQSEGLSYSREGSFSTILWFGSAAIMLLLLGLLLYLARRMEPLRRALAGALGPVLLLPYLVVMGSMMLNFETEAPGDVTHWLLQPVEMLVSFNPHLVLPLLAPATGFTDYSSLPAALAGHWVGLLPLQLLLCGIAAEFARDSIRRRKWGGAAG